MCPGSISVFDSVYSLLSSTSFTMSSNVPHGIKLVIPKWNCVKDSLLDHQTNPTRAQPSHLTTHGLGLEPESKRHAETPLSVLNEKASTSSDSSHSSLNGFINPSQYFRLFLQIHVLTPFQNSEDPTAEHPQNPTAQTSTASTKKAKRALHPKNTTRRAPLRVHVSTDTTQNKYGQHVSVS